MNYAKWRGYFFVGAGAKNEQRNPAKKEQTRCAGYFLQTPNAPAKVRKENEELKNEE